MCGYTMHAFLFLYLASQNASEAILTYTDFTFVTLVKEDTFWDEDKDEKDEADEENEEDERE